MHISLVEITKITKLDLASFDLCVEAKFTKGIIWPFQTEFEVTVYRHNPKIKLNMREHLPCHAMTYYYNSGEKVPRNISLLIHDKMVKDLDLIRSLETKEQMIKEISEHLGTK